MDLNVKESRSWRIVLIQEIGRIKNCTNPIKIYKAVWGRALRKKVHVGIVRAMERLSNTVGAPLHTQNLPHVLRQRLKK
ncbi:MAG: hypothetical protein ACI9UK_002149 [Candidatus Krumholzibacteriia bacterium]|jgi:hypothetical protein